MVHNLLRVISIYDIPCTMKLILSDGDPETVFPETGPTTEVIVTSYVPGSNFSKV